jgi:phosphoglycolate phosphatase
VTASEGDQVADIDGQVLDIEAVVFDKDGTLLDFERTWNPAIARAIHILADGDDAVAALIASTLGYDLVARMTLPGAPLIAASNGEIVAMLPDGLGAERLPDLLAAAVLDTVAAADHAERLLDHLAARGIPIAVATNDNEDSTLAQLDRLGWTSRFVTVLGYDSGHGAKPDPAMVVEACRRLGVSPLRSAMVGDSPADVESGRAAGAATVYVGPDPARGATAHHWIRALDELVHLIP